MIYLYKIVPNPKQILLNQLCFLEQRCRYALSLTLSLAQPWALAWVMAWLGLGFAGAAHADVWGYVDAKGVAHFSAEKIDDRYELYYKGGQSFNTQEGLPATLPAASANATVQAHSSSTPQRGTVTSKITPKLLMFFEVSPNFKAVKHHLREASAAHKIDFELLQALIATESGFDTNAVSPKGAVGLMQLMPPTAQRYGVQADAKTTIEKKLVDPKTNIKAGSRYLRDLLTMFPGKPELALAAYNAGEGAVKRFGNKIPPYPETQNYVTTVMQIYTYLKPPVVVVALAPKPPEVKAPVRVRMEIGGATGRGNMVPSMVPPALAPATTPVVVGQPALADTP
jgi:Transglycosylase SLT domain/Domain of unknown function (DUF4124)